MGLMQRHNYRVVAAAGGARPTAVPGIAVAVAAALVSPLWTSRASALVTQHSFCYWVNV